MMRNVIRRVTRLLTVKTAGLADFVDVLAFISVVEWWVRKVGRYLSLCQASRENEHTSSQLSSTFTFAFTSHCTCGHSYTMAATIASKNLYELLGPLQLPSDTRLIANTPADIHLRQH